MREADGTAMSQQEGPSHISPHTRDQNPMPNTLSIVDVWAATHTTFQLHLEQHQPRPSSASEYLLLAAPAAYGSRYSSSDCSHWQQSH